MNANPHPHEDHRLMSWIQAVTTPGEVQVLGNVDTEVLIYCQSVEVAEALWRSRDVLGSNPPKHPTIWVEGRRYSAAPRRPQLEVNSSDCGNNPMLDIKAMNSPWLKNNIALFRAIEGTCYIYSSESDPRHLAVRPDLSPGRLNKSMDLLLADGGQPLSLIDPVIAVPRAQAIKEAIATGKETYCYHEHFWRDCTWYFESVATKVSDSEVLVIVRDNPKEPKASWQREYWKRVAEASISA